ncbi:phage baseplate assembly protein V [Burkholderia dolosa]|uniref:phage baseplate assembly protein V n=1 Tax=Burkholderia dolosa TaxID=152500 RepID=UPI001B9CB087|nr:phage baseplate assembly protein V [Burkholderia dolosa]MBR8314653.1 phage baseplate assembly protein V [Burkholderia dolosa]
MSFDLAELNRRVANMIRIGTVQSVEAGDTVPTAIVAISGDDGVQLTTDPRPIAVLRAGPDGAAWLPEPGEQVELISPMGDLSQSYVGRSIPCDAFPCVVNATGVWRARFSDGAVIEYDRQAHALNATLPGGTATVTADYVKADTPLFEATHDAKIGGDLEVMGASTLRNGMLVEGGEAGATARFAGGVEVNGPTQLNGNTNVDGDINATGTIMDAGGNSNHHTH